MKEMTLSNLPNDLTLKTGAVITFASPTNWQHLEHSPIKLVNDVTNLYLFCVIKRILSFIACGREIKRRK